MPYLLKPILHQTVWGGSRLSRLLRNCPDDLAHLYLATAHEDMTNWVINADMNLRDLFNKEKARWKMENYEEFPLTIALVDATQNLSIQAHPDAKLAAELEGKAVGKTESWLFLEAPNEGWIYAGCDSDSIGQIKEAVDRGDVDKVVSRLKVEPGDCVCVRDGTLHALTAGSLVYEIEYGSNFTYRFYDYNRLDKNGKKRELHQDKALRALRPERKPTVKRANPNGWIIEKEYELRLLKDTPYYRNESDRLEIVAVIEGDGSAEEMTFDEPVAALLEPGEALDGINIRFGVMARLGEQNGD